MRKHLLTSPNRAAACSKQGVGRATGQSLYDTVTAKIVDALERGVVAWRKPWSGPESLPYNAISKRPYHGINLLVLSFAEFNDHRWLTFRQAEALGGTVKRGERSTPAVFWKRIEIEVDKADSRNVRRAIPLLRYYYLFNVEQCDGLNLPSVERPSSIPPSERMEAAERLVRSMPNPPIIIEGGRVACYRPPTDTVQIPKLSDFESAESYYATLYHELGHATGHESRLNRPGLTGKIEFGSCDYSREELIAELSSAFCCAAIGLDNSHIENAASYIQGWLGALNADPRALMVASGHAQRAANRIQGQGPESNA